MVSRVVIVVENKREKTGESIKNGQFGDTGKIEHTRHSTKTNKAKTQHRKLKRRTTRTTPKTRDEPMSSRRIEDYAV